MYKKISDYGIIGNLHTVALVGSDGSIDWMCLPHLDSPSVFAAILDDEKGGRFSITPAEEWDSVQEYLPETNVLVTRFRTRSAEVELTDFMPVPGEARGAREREHELYRRVRVTRGEARLRVEFDPRFEYASVETTVERADGRLVARSGEWAMTLASSGELSPDPDSDRDPRLSSMTLKEGVTFWFRLRCDSAEDLTCLVEDGERTLGETEGYWRGWLRKRETGRCVDLGHYQPMVDRSALVLKLLQYEQTGTIAAAATTSLPEAVGGVRNWDYRYTWVRDTSFTLEALLNLGHLTETEAYLHWLERLLEKTGSGRLQVMYGLAGQAELAERELTHLDGYKGSRPVRVGNAAAEQDQLDIYGEVMDAALRLSDYVGKIGYSMWPLLKSVCDHVAEKWREPDSGIWEVRSRPRHFVYSRVMCWVALDRGLTIARRYGFPADLERWETEAGEIRREVCEKGWNAEKKSFVQHYETDALDAANLLIPILGFLPFSDPRVASTVEATERELSREGFLHRYSGEDGLPAGEGTFLVCSFWLVDCLVGIGRIGDAEFLLRRLESTTSRLGLFSEEYDPRWREALGNFPQAFTHIGYINSVTRLMDAGNAERREARETERMPLLDRMGFSAILLNDGEPSRDVPSREIALELKNTMNVLRGGFFDTARSRVAYEEMKGAPAYRDFLEVSYELARMDPAELTGREEKSAFWINLYNVIVIHAVIELGVRDSVKEVWNFFTRVRYQVGEHEFTPFDIEHGVLRGNRRPPHAILRAFGEEDPRLAFSVEPLDPRVHFALVCASSSCPPIDVYTPEGLDEELDISGRTFLNAGGAVVDRDSATVRLSRIFKWYSGDFAPTREDLLRFVARYLYRDEDREFLEERAEELAVVYQPYDWRLNRG